MLHVILWWEGISLQGVACNPVTSLQLNGKATLIVAPGSTTIHNCSDEKLRGVLKEVVMRQLVQI